MPHDSNPFESVRRRDLLSLPEVADELGMSVITIRRWISTGKLPAVRVGGLQIRVRRSDLESVMTPIQPAPR